MQLAIFMTHKRCVGIGIDSVNYTLSRFSSTISATDEVDRITMVEVINTSLGQVSTNVKARLH
jgi:hypothetical protein